MSYHSQDFYQFQFDAGLSRVLKMFEVDGRKTKAEKITGNTFEIDTNASGAVTQVVRTELSRKGETEVSIYSDANGDQRFEKTFEIEVAGASTRFLEQHRFTFDSAGNVTAEMERKGNGAWKSERIDANEHFQLLSLNGVNYLVKTETERDGIEFTLLRDDNGDGIWSQIAEGEATGLHLNGTTGSIDLVGIQNYLVGADSIVG